MFCDFFIDKPLYATYTLFSVVKKELMLRVKGAVIINLYLAFLVTQDDKSWHEKDNEIHRFGHAQPVLTKLTSFKVPRNKDFIDRESGPLGC